eukprot:TRINITY_DN905_c0_g1_i1.p1 TRINITY_DN905_c0_g1~~TRINITY_DN905_c0_g1_i1.p1  ORF type:complete len:191 (-),score=46.31 TRINITY_DN905_c0_g1_i1:153-725(-)
MEDVPQPLALFWSFFHGDVTTSGFEEMEIDEVPSPFRELLCHNAHMTLTLEKHYHQPMILQVLNTLHMKDSYTRTITLNIPNTQPDTATPYYPVQFALMRINLKYFSDQFKTDVISAKIPLGRILQDHKIIRQVKFHKVFKFSKGIDFSSDLTTELEKHIALPTFGRQATIFCDNNPAIELLEVLNGDTL